MSPDEYDSPWKIAIERYFPEFMAFFFPKAHARIDWSAGYVFLNKELQQVVRDAELGRRYVDKLVQVRLLDGGETRVCIHIEVQGDPDEDFARRMFVYNYRLFDRFGQPPASLAVLADEQSGWRPDGFEYEILDCRMQFAFPVVKLLDKQPDLPSLLDSDNAFALVTAAHLLTRQTKASPTDRYAAKIRLIRILFTRGWDRQRVLDLFAIIDWLMFLPKDLDRKFDEDIRHIEEETMKPYVTSIERLAREDGYKEGQSQILQLLLSQKFGSVPGWAEQRLLSAEPEQLAKWSVRLLDAKSLEDVLAVHDR